MHTSHDGKTAALTGFYANLLGAAERTSWSFDLDALYAQLPRVDASPLTSEFTASEALAAVRAMNPDSAPGPDGLGPAISIAWKIL
jgi:hypothetical protein